MISLNWHLMLVVIAWVWPHHNTELGTGIPCTGVLPVFTQHFSPLKRRQQRQDPIRTCCCSLFMSSRTLTPLPQSCRALSSPCSLHGRAKEQGLTPVDSLITSMENNGSGSRLGSARLSLRCCFALLPRNLQECSRANHIATSPSTLKIYMAGFPLLKYLPTKLCSKMIHRCCH